LSQNGPRILIVDDETAILETVELLFRKAGYRVSTAVGGRKGLEALESERPDVVVTDIKMPGASGIDIVNRARELDPELPVILMTAYASVRSAVDAVNAGAYSYIQKPFSNDEMLAVVKRAAEARSLKVENRALKKEVGRSKRISRERPIGKSRSFNEVLTLTETVAPTDSTILITGESGTGKEVLARYIHALSARSDGPFLSINCGALPESLLESELFGHVKGSFTGAVKDRDGLLVAAAGGTFFLDEIGETSPATQVKLLRALQEREVIPVGATQAVPVDVRIIAATNRDLDEEIRKGAFRSDLYYRLNVIAIRLPALRDRKDDIPILATHFLEQMGVERSGRCPTAISQETMEILLRYDWPGNVRELENALERAAVLTRGDRIEASALPERLREAPTQELVSHRLPANPTLDVIEQAYIQWVLAAEGGNKTRAAEVLGIDPSTLYRKLSRYGEGQG